MLNQAASCIQSHGALFSFKTDLLLREARLVELSSHLCAVEVQLAFGSVPNFPVDSPSHLTGCPQDFSGLTFCMFSVPYSILEYKSGFYQQVREGLCVYQLLSSACVCVRVSAGARAHAR